MEVNSHGNNISRGPYIPTIGLEAWVLPRGFTTLKGSIMKIADNGCARNPASHPCEEGKWAPV